MLEQTCRVVAFEPEAATAAIRRTGVTEYPASEAASLRLDAGGFDHLGPLFGFFGDQLFRTQPAIPAAPRRGQRVSTFKLVDHVVRAGMNYKFW
jgi:hypothetical protein